MIDESRPEDTIKSLQKAIDRISAARVPAYQKAIFVELEAILRRRMTLSDSYRALSCACIAMILVGGILELQFDMRLLVSVTSVVLSVWIAHRWRRELLWLHAARRQLTELMEDPDLLEFASQTRASGEGQHEREHQVWREREWETRFIRFNAGMQSISRKLPTVPEPIVYVAIALVVASASLAIALRVAPA